MNSSIKIESTQGLEHFQKLNMDGEVFGRVLGMLAEVPSGNANTVTVVRDGRSIVFTCDASLDVIELLKTANYKKRIRTAKDKTAEAS